MIDGSKSNGIYKVDYTTPVSDVSKITNFSGGTFWPMKPKWSPDCKMISFLGWDRSDMGPPSRTSVYIINLDNNTAGFSTATLPVTSLDDDGVYQVYDFASNTISESMPAFAPNWSADAKLVSFSVDTTKALDITNFLNLTPDTLVDQLFNVDFDSYMEYIMDQPDSLGGIVSPQLVGQLGGSEFGMVQCPGTLAGADCGVTDNNYPFVHIMQFNTTEGAYLRLVKMDDRSAVSGEGGLLFQDGIVTAVFPPNVVASDTVFWNTDPTVGYCGGAVDAGNCPLDPTNEFIVQAGDAREFFPDGTNFKSYVRLIFHYCDTDDNGKVDANTEGVEAIAAAGTFSYNPLNGDCQINGIDTGGGTIDEDTMAVYNWDRANTQWVRMDGFVDKDNNTITVFADHFSRYDTLGFRFLSQQVLTPLAMTNIHTYPNPYVIGRHTGGLRFTADTMNGDADITIDIQVYDIRGSLVASLMSIVPSDFQSVFENNGYTLLNWGTPLNNAGRQLASGVYLYYMHARDTNGYTVTYKGKFSVVR